MLTPSNLKVIEFATYTANSDGEPVFGTGQNHSLLFNCTQISEQDLDYITKNGAWRTDNRVVEITKEQLEYLHDKE